MNTSIAHTPRRVALLSLSLDTLPSLRPQLNAVLIAWMFGSFWLWTISGATMTQFARAMGTPDWGFGVLAALPFIGTIAQVPAALWLQRRGGRRAFFLVTASLARMLWVFVAMIPWIVPEEYKQLWWPLMAFVLFVSWCLGQACGPAWMSWMSDVIPRSIRGRFFARRNMIAQPIALVATLGIGYALDLALHVNNPRPDLILYITSTIIAVAGLMGTLDILCFRVVPDHHPPPPETGEKFGRMLMSPLKGKNFRRYLIFNFLLMLGLGFVGQYVWLYVFDVCGWSSTKANFMLICLPLVISMLAFPVWGKLVDRMGKKPVLLIAGVAVTVGSVGWLGVSAESIWPGYLLILPVIFCWPGFEIANFNIVLDLAGGDSKDRRNAGTAYVALTAMAVAIGGTLSGLLAGFMARRFEGFEATVPLLGNPLTYHGLLFLGSAFLRGGAILIATQLVEPKAKSTRDVIRYMTVSLYGNVRQAAMMPTRVVGKVARWTYKIDGSSNRGR